MIKLIRTRSEFLDYRKDLTGTLGLVPTMGNLHAGHLSLLKQSLQDNQHSVISIFVNPTQFGENEDFSAYPRTLAADIELITNLEQPVTVLAPSTDAEIYEGSTELISAGEMGQMLEGNLRPGHFEGVLTVIDKLFQLVTPHKAYFGKKDYQQVRVIQKFTRMHFPSIDIVALPIVREPSCLAMSSRNHYLSEQEKTLSLKLYRSLSYVEKILTQDKDLPKALSAIQDLMEQDDRFNYFTIRKQSDLTPPLSLQDSLVILGNYQLGTTRLLDNIEVP